MNSGNDRKLKVFVASSTEAKKIKQYVMKILEDNYIDPVDWKEINQIGEYGLETLLNTSSEVDGAIIIATCDDKIWCRDEEKIIPRDNILFEMGLFIKALGRKHAPLVFVQNDKEEWPEIPTDILGLNTVRFYHGKDVNNRDRLEKWINELKRDAHHFYRYFNVLIDRTKNHSNKIPDNWVNEILGYVSIPLENMSKGMLMGEYLLDVGQYYKSVSNCLELADLNTTIRAISFISSETWINDENQQKFLLQNIKARQRGATIQRLFIIPEGVSSSTSAITEQIKHDFKIKTIRMDLIMSLYPELNDLVMFDIPNTCCYMSIRPFNTTKLLGAKLVLDRVECTKLTEAFDSAWKNADDLEENLKENLTGDRK